MSLNESKRFPLRAAALSTMDVLAAEVILFALGESEAQAIEALRGSCWAADLSADPVQQRESLRGALAGIGSTTPKRAHGLAWGSPVSTCPPCPSCKIEDHVHALGVGKGYGCELCGSGFR